MSEAQPNMRRTQQRVRKADTRERILKEAAAVIRSEGAEKAGVAAIMARAGLTVGGFYAHFSSKDALLADAVRFMFEERYAAFLKNQDDPDARAVLIRFVENYLSMRHRDAVDHGCPIPALAAEIGRLADPIRAEFTRGIESLEAALQHLLERMGRDDPQALAASMISEMTGALSLARVQPDPAKAQAILSASREQVSRRAGMIT